MAELVIHEPATGAELWRGPTGDVAAEVAAAAAAWAPWAARPLPYRVEAMRRFANAVRARHDALSDLVARETGRPLWDARGEMDAVVARVDAAISANAERTAQRRLESPMGARTALRHKPHGVVAAITPGCQPAEAPAGHLIPALIAGNAVVLKPSERAPATAALLVECFRAAGVPEGCVRLLIGGPAEGAALAAHPDVAAVLFTGSSRVGLTLHRAAIDRPERLLALEMGGNNPIVAWETPDIAATAAIVVQSAFAAAGQRCTAARRLVVAQDAAEPLIAEVSRLAGRLIVGAPHDSPTPFMGPMASEAAADDLSERFLDLLMRGGRAIRHLGRPAPGLPFLSPAIIDVTDVPDRPDAELFGPVLQVIRVPSFDEAIAEANATRFGLSATLISQTPALYGRFWAAARAGIINWNRPSHGAGPGAPRVGLGRSGNARAGGIYAADLAAYPVVGSEAEIARASLGVGLRDA